MEYNNFSSKIELCYHQIRNAEESESLRLDMARNQLMVVNVVISVVTSFIGFGAFISGIFGMNLDQTRWLQSVHGVFTGVCIGALCFIIFGATAVLSFLLQFGYVPK